MQYWGGAGARAAGAAVADDIVMWCLILELACTIEIS